MRKRTLVIAGVLVVAVGIGAWFYSRDGGSAGGGEQAAPPVAQVKTQPLLRREVTDTLETFGELSTGQVVAVSFPRAGQVSRLWVLDGSTVKKGDPIATLVSDPAARMAYEQAVHAEELAKSELARTGELFKLQLATRSQLDNASKALADAQAAVQAQRRLGGDLQSQTVRAPFAGVVVKLAVAQGDRVQPGATIAQMGHTDEMRAHLGVQPEQAARVRIGMPVAIAPVDEPNAVVHAHIDALHDIIDPSTRLVDAVAIVHASSADPLVPGMKVRGRISLDTHMAWLVPRDAVLEENGKAYLFQVQGGNARRVDVEKRGAYGDLQAIAGPFDPKLPVVALGNYELKDGMAVREAPAGK
ncbi:MAG TPA: efflux RND transporter periplasmic adaptor subunit [Burkholderiales bacterium]|nr:efflux RND transporter periplasmic adaptor subunit [Burkholderiales bacterium]